jgi:hypothetical protein
LHDRRRGLGHLGHQFIDRFRIVDQFAQRLPIFFKQCGGLLEALHDLLIGRNYRGKRVFDEFQPRQRAGGNRLVGIDDEGIGERGDGLKLRGGFFRAESDRRKFRIVGVTGQIVELVTQHVAAAGKLILRYQGAVALDLEDVGKDLGEGPEFSLQARDLIEARPICGALHRLIDGVLQTGFG